MGTICIFLEQINFYTERKSFEYDIQSRYYVFDIQSRYNIQINATQKTPDANENELAI